MRKAINHVLSMTILAYITLVLANERERSNENARSIFDTITYNIDSFYGMMYLDAWLGTPSQRVTLAISLTSDLMVVPCNDVSISFLKSKCIIFIHFDDNARSATRTVRVILT